MDKIPTFEPTDTVNSYFKKVEEYKLSFDLDKYNMVLEFINEWLILNKKNKLISLYDFKNLSEIYLLKNKKHNNKILRKYVKTFTNNNIGLNFNIDSETDSDEIKDKYILLFLSEILNKIDYVLVKRQYNNGVYYYIKKN